MAYLKIFDESANLLANHSNLDEIKAALLEAGVAIERWRNSARIFEETVSEQTSSRLGKTNNLSVISSDTNDVNRVSASSSSKREYKLCLSDMSEDYKNAGIEVAQHSCGLSDDEILKLYDEEIARIKSQFNFKAVDLMSINPEFAKREDFNDLRNKFLKEHIHSDDEVRYFIEGSGLFTIHHQKKVFSILCSAGDFISVPANTLHWFDMGISPSFKCLRFFSDESGWVPVYSENSIAKRFPCLDEFDKLGSLS